MGLFIGIVIIQTSVQVVECSVTSLVWYVSSDIRD